MVIIIIIIIIIIIYHTCLVYQNQETCHEKETPRLIIWRINAKVTDALNPSVMTQYCVIVTEIIKHDVKNP